MANTTIPWWRGLWCMQQTVPFALDTDTLTPLEILNKLVKAVDKLIEDGKLTAQEIQKIYQMIQDLRDYVDGPLFAETIYNWVMCNMPCLLSSVCQWFVFSINDNGNIVVSIPNSWEWANLNWDMDFDSDTFGHFRIGW